MNLHKKLALWGGGGGITKDVQYFVSIIRNGQYTNLGLGKTV